MCLGCIKRGVQLKDVSVGPSVRGRGSAVAHSEDKRRRKRREWSLGSGDKWPVQQWRTSLLAACVTCKDTGPPPQGASARDTLKGRGRAVSITRDPPSQQVRDVWVSQNKGIYNVGMMKIALNQILFGFVLFF